MIDIHFYDTNFIFTSSSIILTNSEGVQILKNSAQNIRIFVEIDNCCYKYLNICYSVYVILSFDYSGII